MKRILTPEQAELLHDGEKLREWVQRHPDNFSDYSFLVAPFAKAYEGFLKSLFLKLGLIGKDEYYSDHFRVGKVLNPALRQRRWSVYPRLEAMGEQGEKIAAQLWQAWKEGRNLIFHYFPHNLHRLDLKEANRRIEMILAAMRKATKLLS